MMEPATKLSEWLTQVDTLPGDYTFVKSGVVFGDSLLIVADAGRKELIRVDRLLSSAVPFGRAGSGPGEYSNVVRLFKLGADSVLVVGGSIRQPIQIVSVRDGMGRTVNPSNADGLRAFTYGRPAPTVPRPLAADTLGYLFVSSPYRQSTNDRATPRILETDDSTKILSYNLTTGAVKELASYFNRTMLAVSKEEMGRFNGRISWSVTTAGQLVLVNPATYEITIGDNARGERVHFSIPFVKRDIGRAEWREYLRKEHESRASSEDSVAASILRPFGARIRRADRPMTNVDAPSYIPPVALGARPSLLASQNSLWIASNRSFQQDTPIWDVICIRSRKRVNTVELPKNSRPVIATNNGLFLVVRNDEDVESIVRYSRPDRESLCDDN